MSDTIFGDDCTAEELEAAEREFAKQEAAATEFCRLAPIKFAEAWAKAVRLAGPSRMGIDELSLENPTDQWRMKPDIDYISENIGTYSTSEQILIATLVGFYSEDASLRLFHSLGRSPCIATIAWRLDDEVCDALCELIRWYHGW